MEKISIMKLKLPNDLIDALGKLVAGLNAEL